MLFLKNLFLIIIVNYYSSCVAEKYREFNDLTLNEFIKSCEKNNQSYEKLSTTLSPIWNELLMNTTIRGCSDDENRKLISKLVNETLKCFENNKYLNRTGKIVDQIIKKLCPYYKIVNFKANQEKCIEHSVEEKCLKEIMPIKFDYFFSLSMIHTKEECTRLLKMTYCTMNGIKIGCNDIFSDIYEGIIQEYSSALRCQKK
ncbi:uncharacterized protein LOC122506480 [Leptopilina heterotoma]|uniref:uncharacterized protein LOC122506480 n=1 Tax=Leptopilina heterotoma TaxID=63436 RepID=UPI001CA82140|nr:uncharacterized protein LOC122506480 [Leptopilina heterotoma]